VQKLRKRTYFNVFNQCGLVKHQRAVALRKAATGRKHILAAIRDGTALNASNLSHNHQNQVAI
jgi:hypothetical protein